METKNRFIWIFATVALALFVQVKYAGFAQLGYVFVIGSMALSFMAEGGKKVNMACVMLLVAGVLSILMNRIPEFFKPWPRLGLFAMLMLGCSPLLRGPGIDRVRRHLLIGALWAQGTIALWSMAAYYTGTGLYMPGFVKSYMGVCGHANFLGFFSMIAAVWLAALFFRCTNMRERIIVGGSWMGCLLVIMLCASRSALGMSVIGTIIVTYLRNKDNMGNLAVIAGAVVAATFLAWPVLAPYMEVMNSKTESAAATEGGVVAATRGSIWELRYAEIDESPIVGVGAYSCDITLPNAGVFYSETNGSIELGNSYLGLLSQVGWLGFSAFMLTLLPIFWKAWQYATKNKTPYAQLMVGLLVPVSLHMLFEGYAMTAGAGQCIVLWLILSAADQCDTVADYAVAWEKFDPPTPEQYRALISGNYYGPRG